MPTEPVRPWIRLAPTLALLALLLWLFRDTGAAMVDIWIRSETFTHAFLVPPIAVWLAWRQRHRLVTVPDRPVGWLLIAVAGACFLWLLGELATVNAASQFALVAMIVATVVAVHGWAVARVLAFPLGFLFFAVPLGEFLVPMMMESTADFTVAALRFTGIPVYREGLNFIIPSGSWSVVEACSGVRYLIASLMVGTLFAYLNYRSLARRLAFVGVAILVPIVANWLRAYLIVMVGHLSGNELATGVDHLVYGWVFFGIVIGIMFMIGARFADAGDPPAAGELGAPVAPVLRPAVPVLAAALLVGTHVLMWQLTHDDAAVPRAPALAAALDGGWAAADGAEAAALPWAPGFGNPSATAERSYRQDDRTAWLWVGYYRQQGDDRKLVSSVNGILGLDEKGWAQAARGATRVDLPGGPVALRSAELREALPLSVVDADRLAVRMVYRVAGRWTTSDAVAKVLQALQRLAGQGDDGAVVLLATPSGPQADATLAQLAAASLPALAQDLDALRAER